MNLDEVCNHILNVWHFNPEETKGTSKIFTRISGKNAKRITVTKTTIAVEVKNDDKWVKVGKGILKSLKIRDNGYGLIGINA
jgi:hypothetical protein